jgi:AcrR family transcriptional regulator
LARKPQPHVQRRLPAPERRKKMLADAALHFADHGFESPTRNVATALGVTQALIYKHFASKDDLIERMLESLFAAPGPEGHWIEPSQPLEPELLRYYSKLASGSNEVRMRLFIRAGLDGRSWPTRRGSALTRGLFLPVIASLRRDADLPGLDAIPAMRGERELVMTLHASIVFLGIRRHIYRMPMPDTLDDVVELYVSTFVRGAAQAMQHLHNTGENSLKVALVVARE